LRGEGEERLYLMFYERFYILLKHADGYMSCLLSYRLEVYFPKESLLEKHKHPRAADDMPDDGSLRATRHAAAQDYIAFGVVCPELLLHYG